jgi:acyl-CoA synthetase (AMP-forming)/AMP-acid ligase II
MYNCPEFLFTLFALAKLGAIAAPIDTRLTDDALAHVLTETDTDVVIVDDNTKSAYDAVRNDQTNITSEFCVSKHRTKGPYREFDSLYDGDESAPPGTDIDPSDPCSILYVQRYQRTNPQGVILPHYSYLNTGIKSCNEILKLSDDDCIFTTLPLYSSYPMQIGVTGALVAGAKFAFEKQFDSDRFWDWIQQYDTTVFLYLGRMLSVLYNQAESDNQNPASYALGHGFGYDTDKGIIADFERRFNVTVLEAYGITPTATLATANDADNRRLGSVGLPIDHAEIKIVDENDWEVPTGEAGEILVRPTEPNVMFHGFYQDAELTARVSQNQWIHTNDVGHMDEDGYLYFVASKRNTIHLGRVGGRISSLEIESVIRSHPDVSDVVVLGVTDSSGEEMIKAVVVPEKEDTVSPIVISKHCEKQLTYHKLPRYIEIRDELPRSSSGKVRSDLLRNTSPNNTWDRRSGYDLNR